MTHVFFILIGCALIALTRRLYYYNFELFLCCLIIVNFDFFHLVPRLGEFDQYQESLLVVILFYLLEEYVVGSLVHKDSRIATPELGLLGKIIFLYLIILFLGIWVAFYQGQGLIFGIKAFKVYPILLTYFLILKKGLDIEKFTTYFLWMAVGTATLTFIQFLSFGKLNLFFFYEDASAHIRGLGSVRGLRIVEGSTVITLGVCVAYIKWLKYRQKEFLAMTVFLFVQALVVMQTRGLLIAIIIVCLVSYLYYDRDKNSYLKKKILLLTTCAVISIVVTSFFPTLFTEMEIYNQTISDIQKVSTGKGTGNMEVRVLCYTHYWEEIKLNWLTGRGLLNENWVGNPDPYLREYFGYHLSDVGAFHVIVGFGIFGGVLILLGVFAIIKTLRKVYDTRPEVCCYFSLGLIMLPQIDIFFTLNHIFLFSIFSACVDCDQLV